MLTADELMAMHQVCENVIDVETQVATFHIHEQIILSRHLERLHKQIISLAVVQRDLIKGILEG